MDDDVWMENARVLKNTVMQTLDVELVRILQIYKYYFHEKLNVNFTF